MHPARAGIPPRRWNPVREGFQRTPGIPAHAGDSSARRGFRRVSGGGRMCAVRSRAGERRRHPRGGRS
ncbi:hypothetical protein FYC51_03620 [Agromyces mariniharenae]|uniref:Uncharacterized protein n=1 Tax=Agromyces mariniharenae TaxID=2604423 RepID=A0A5S4V490_9MICO|nr:hypothetical protein FYC51_03620 [Agromyces mariniharenae]